MKTGVLSLALALTVVLPAHAQLSPPVSDTTAKIVATENGPKLSQEVAQKLTEKLPKYALPEPEKPKPAPDPDVLELEKVIVTQKKRPRLNDEALMTTKGFNDKLARERTSSLDRNVLNKFSWLGGASAAARAREEYEYEKRTQLADQVFGLAKVVEVTDPEQAKVIRDAMARP